VKKFKQIGRLVVMKCFVGKSGNFEFDAFFDGKPMEFAKDRRDVVGVASGGNNSASQAVLHML
jgi:hypothetical protein